MKQIGAEHGDCRDSGAGTMLTVGIALGTIVLITALLALTQATVGAARAGVAADLAALAGADTIRGLRAGDPCSVAEDVVARNGGDLASCAPDVGSRSVTVEVRSRGGGLLPWAPSASARAGPPR
ncbi:Rv3654c family TadE-like protein [Arthrobacter gallicola]|uniref:Rv3654c family TadE-like protein n=1 Tax=Arthrobacter gallicola TaxID=2762225 RepID=UPI00296AD8CC|nr:Rv3654c family TadE-like protein [Arthrobacter gallicola]